MNLLVSCISTRHSALKDHWTQSSEQTQCPLSVRGSYAKPDTDLGGLLCSIDIPGGVQKTLDLSAAAGMTLSERGVLVTTFNSIHEVDAALDHVKWDKVSLPSFNALHSLSRTRRGYLVANTGVDQLVEFDQAGNLLWEWWATDHGFNLTPTGSPRELDKTLDHRALKYGTLSQTTHVNSAAELPDGTILATLFHQGSVIAIERETGVWRTILEGLDHPHAVRILDDTHFTVADTVHGHALLASLDKQSGIAQVEERIDAQTTWLQDCSYDLRRKIWTLVDGQRSRLTLLEGRAGQHTFAEVELDPEWRLYEALLIA